MTLVEKFSQEVNKVGLDFRITKECNDKFKGILTDKKTLVEVPYELHKSTQLNMLKSHIKWVRNYVDMAISLRGVTK